MVTYRPSLILLVHRRLPQRGMKFGCAWARPIDNTDEVLTNVGCYRCIAIHDLFTGMTIAHSEAQRRKLGSIADVRVDSRDWCREPLVRTC